MRTSVALCCVNCIVFGVVHGLGKSTSFGTSLVITSFVFCYLSYIVFWSCSRAWKKHKLLYEPSDDFFHILLFM